MFDVSKTINFNRFSIVFLSTTPPCFFALVHVPPPEHEELGASHSVGPYVAPQQKHYKIIFIKAPSQPSYSRVQQQIAAQNEEKTLVYVLVKKPDTIEDIQKSIPQPTHIPSKPEVYFIKYKV